MYFDLVILTSLQCLKRDRLVIPDANKNDAIWGTGQLGKNDVTWWQANITGLPPNQKSKQSRVTNLSLFKHLMSVC
jgi:hypothetical protein